MKTKNIIFYLIAAVFVLTGCEEYEEYTGDFEYSTVYFGTQKPLRTVVAREDEMNFRFGVSLGGKYTNDKEESVGYKIDTSLLRTVANSAYLLLPEQYYTLSDNSGKFTIPAGEIIGDITLTLDRESFCSDPLALTGGYALPLQLDSVATVDSVLVGNDVIPAKDYTVIVVKYISPYSGTYYQRGTQTVTTADSTYVLEYDNKDLSRNQTIDFTTVSVDSVAFTTLTRTKDDVVNSEQHFKLHVKDDKTCVLLPDATKEQSGDFAPVNGTWEWVDEENYLLKINLVYSYTDAGMSFDVDESYTLRRSPEKDLRFETW